MCHASPLHGSARCRAGCVSIEIRCLSGPMVEVRKTSSTVEIPVSRVMHHSDVLRSVGKFTVVLACLECCLRCMNRTAWNSM